MMSRNIRAQSGPSTAARLGVSEWSPEGLYDKCVSLIRILMKY